MDTGDSQVAALLSRLTLREEAAHLRCGLLARDLELGRAAVALLELVCHADAALEDLRAIAAPRGVRSGGVGATIAAALTTARAWADRLLFDPASAWRGALDEARGGLAVACELQRAARAEGDALLHAWCEAWIAQRTPMVRALEVYAREPRAQPSW